MYNGSRMVAMLEPFLLRLYMSFHRVIENQLVRIVLMVIIFYTYEFKNDAYSSVRKFMDHKDNNKFIKNDNYIVLLVRKCWV